MAYPVVCDECLTEDCVRCLNEVKTRVSLRNTPPEELICGGAFCICPHGQEHPNYKWYEEVLERSREAWRKNND